MSKTALILHGWPQTEINQRFLLRFLLSKGFKIIIPNLYLIEKGWGIEKVSRKIVNELEDCSPDLIVGISMGGLILPHIAQKFPKSKLLFISTGSRFEPKLMLTKLGIVLLRFRSLRKLLISIGDNTPIPVLEFLYKVFDPFTGNKRDGGVYQEDLKLNIKVMKSYSFEIHLTLLDLIHVVDNTKTLQGIKNKALIFNGKYDQLMPKEKGDELHKLLENSTLIINNNEHFNVLQDKDLVEVGKFLRN